MSAATPTSPGTVYLVGAGPGAPELLTLRAHELLRTADVVAYDELVPPELVELAADEAILVPVGRRARRGGAPPAYRLHPAVLEHSRRGRSVVRLKAGDPLVFGRGGEEAEELSLAGVPFEIVPGITSALGAAAYAGIPLTHRDLASDVAFASGHDLAGVRGSHTDFAPLAAAGGTLVLYMATRALAANLARLVTLGRAKDTPAALIVRATTAGHRVVEGTLDDLAQRAAGVDEHEPALVVVGDVVGKRAVVRWWDRRPLAGRRVLLGRARPEPSDLAGALRRAGATVVEAPRVRRAPPSSFAALDAVTDELAAGDTLVFASASAVAAWVERLAARGRDLRHIPSVPIVALGEGAGQAARRAGLVPAAVTAGSCAVALRIPAVENARRALVVAGEGERPGLAAALTALGVRAEFAPAYALRRTPLRLPTGGLDAVVLPCSSSVAALGEVADGPVPVVCMGPETAAAARRAGAENVITVADDHRDALLAAVLVALRHPRRPDAGRPSRREDVQHA